MQITIKTKAEIDKRHPELCGRRCPRWRIHLETGAEECRAYDVLLYQTAYKIRGEYRNLRCRQCVANRIR